jgi:rare lipoprotein A
MNQKILSGITTTALTTVLGTAVFLGNSLTKTIASTNSPNPSEASLRDNSSQDDLSNPSQLTTANPEKPVASLYSHRWQGSLAVTLRVRNIPILTFLEPLPSSVKPAHAKISVNPLSQSNPSVPNPVVRAKAVAARLNQLAQENFDASKIVASWDAQTQSYSIKVDGEELVSLDNQTILSDTTKNWAIDALQATNRLRRLMGNAPPLDAIAGLPKASLNKVGAPEEIEVSRVKGRYKGMASWYGPGFHGRRTASGERFNSNGLTAAHRHLPFGTKVRVTNAINGRSIVVRINDRGPFSRGRIIDLSAGAAKAIGVFQRGTAPVRVEVLGL